MFPTLQRGTVPSLRRHLPAGWDTHAHILPGVDDGAAGMDEALGIIRALQASGLKGAVCTPHIMARYPGNTPSSLRARFLTLQQEAAAACPGFGLQLAAEYMVDDLLPRHLQDPAGLLTHPGASPAGEGTGQGTPAGQPRYLLLELPQYLLPAGWADMLLAPLQLGLAPLLAHPERYYRLLDLDDLGALHRQGVRFQGNLGSLRGLYGSPARQLARQLSRLGLYHCWGTDAHSPAMAASINLQP